MKVNMSISGDFITRQARQFWQECEYSKAYRLLECLMGTTREMHEDVLQGRKKFTGINEITLEDDAWTPPKHYATLDEVFRRAGQFGELQERREAEARPLLVRVARLRDPERFSTGDDAAEASQAFATAARLIGRDQAAKLLVEVIEDPPSWREVEAEPVSPPPPEDLERYAPPEMGGLAGAYERARQTLMRMQMKSAGFEPVVPTADALLYRGTNLVPTLCPDMSSENGWLLPNGKYYGCGTMEHIGLAERILESLGKNTDDQDAVAVGERLGWVKLAKSFTGFHCLSQKKPTKAQINKLWIYAQHHGRDYKELVQSLPGVGDL